MSAEILKIVDIVLLVLSTAFLFMFVWASIEERERRATVLAILMLLGNAALWCGFIFLGHLAPVRPVNLAVLAAAALFGFVSLLKFFPRRPERDLSGAEPFDERDHMFSRNMTQAHPELMDAYYKAHPERREGDEKLHARPELGEPGHVFYDAGYSPVFESAFKYLAQTRGAAEGEVAPEKTPLDKGKVSRIIKELGLYYGAVSVGITEMKPYHWYTCLGRQPGTWGKKFDKGHRYGIALVVPMRVDMMKAAPDVPAILESSRLYVEAAKVAHIIAEYIRGLGYDARSQTDGDYRVMCVPVAVDAGVGILSRMGILMDPVHGPCIRISVVTTDLELEVTPPGRDFVSMEFFCDICKKCADNCPTGSISDGDEETESRGFRHWGIKQETCYGFWKNVGTDCGFCIRVCPYTKPDTFVHKLVRFYISRNWINQRIALLMDDVFYGRKLPVPTVKTRDSGLYGHLMSTKDIGRK